MTRKAGRSRDTGIDARILAVAAEHLSRDGYQAMSLAAIAEQAGTTRQALYRRWPGKAELAAAVVTNMADDGQAITPADPYRALVAELADFQRGVSMPGRLSLVGTMLQDTTQPEVLARYRARVVVPRRSRLLAILEAARVGGLVDADADLEVALTMCTGSWYGRALAEDAPPPDWPERTAALIWRAIGGRGPGGPCPDDRPRP
ncbi:TetR/AcrR family transcriptional regulator [Actinomadura barringtoniae]|uniref:TetR/AcrR family transcriptional regulator n=1 Tax=Actinomadura barringtoniae TaxID=1427535 RepID=A0A939PAD1_9ACTN|nr:TetR/AcrR family transcriptional regulator [Actinomadura barringtoniae]MBO2445934.1 TetR/AcrR family transcriptional regulator [Actinomadura barringtoniae]